MRWMPTTAVAVSYSKLWWDAADDVENDDDNNDDDVESTQHYYSPRFGIIYGERSRCDGIDVAVSLCGLEHVSAYENCPLDGRTNGRTRVTYNMYQLVHARTHASTSASHTHAHIHTHAQRRRQCRDYYFIEYLHHHQAAAFERTRTHTQLMNVIICIVYVRHACRPFVRGGRCVVDDVSGVYLSFSSVMVFSCTSMFCLACANFHISSQHYSVPRIVDINSIIL